MKPAPTEDEANDATEVLVRWLLAKQERGVDTVVLKGHCAPDEGEVLEGFFFITLCPQLARELQQHVERVAGDAVMRERFSRSGRRLPEAGEC